MGIQTIPYEDLFSPPIPSEPHCEPDPTQGALPEVTWLCLSAETGAWRNWPAGAPVSSTHLGPSLLTKV